MDKWCIEPLDGKYYGTKITKGRNCIEVWTGYTGKVSQRELDDGWDEEYGFDHVESDRDYKLACIICEALNKEDTE
jgi:hypothetical protein